MGFALSLLYIVTYYLTPVTVFGPLAQYRIELIIAALAVLVSASSMARSFVFRTPQTLAVAGMAIGVALSLVVGEHWAGGAVPATLAFIPNAFAYLIVCVNCNSRKRLEIVVATLMSICLFVIARGIIEQRSSAPPQARLSKEDEAFSYQLSMRTAKGVVLYRLRGLGEIHDPNDFAELVVCVIPLAFALWRKRKAFRNAILVVAPLGVMIYGVFLTHSRGALLALVAMVITAGRRRLGTVWSLLIGGVVFAGAMALNFTGGRDISADAGADRTSLWGEGLEVFKEHPLFGVGLGQLPDFTDSHHTAHNSVVVCAAELGVFGLICWSFYLFPTLRDALSVASAKDVTDPPPIDSARVRTSPSQRDSTIGRADINHLGRLMVLSLVGYLVTAWFLSRAYALILFLLGGLIEIVYQIALERRMIAPRLRLTPVVRHSTVLAFVLVLVMYALLRGVNLGH